MSQEAEKKNQGRQEERAKETAGYILQAGYCLQLGSNYCKKECPKGCYQRYQEQIDKLFKTIDSEKQ